MKISWPINYHVRTANFSTVPDGSDQMVYWYSSTSGEDHSNGNGQEVPMASTLLYPVSLLIGGN